MKTLFDQSSYRISKLITNTYSTSFSIGIKLLAPSIRNQIYAIYGFVRYADEIVDSFHEYDQKSLLMSFERDYQLALINKISLNPILNSFQEVVHQYQLHELVGDFMASMKMDLDKTQYLSQAEYEQYIYGSADVVGLMCLKVFVNGDKNQYEHLKPSAMKLGSAFQKVNFLRDIKNDYETLGRSYFPNVNDFSFTEQSKNEIVEDIRKDFKDAKKGIIQLPLEGKLGVYVAYGYYMNLLRKLSKKESKALINERTRISNHFKIFILFKSFVRYKLNIL